MSNVAICLSGMPRNVANSYNWLKASVLDVLDRNNINWYICARMWGNPSQKECYEMICQYKPKVYEFEDWNEEKGIELGWNEFKNHKFEIEPRVNALGQFYNIYKCNELKNKYEKENNIKSDIVFRIRTELRFNNSLDVKELEIANNNKDIIFLRRGPNPQNPMWVKDNFAFGSSKSMDIYSNCFNNFLQISRDTKVCTAELVLRNYLFKHIKEEHLHHTSLDYTLVRN